MSATESKHTTAASHSCAPVVSDPELRARLVGARASLGLLAYTGGRGFRADAFAPTNTRQLPAEKPERVRASRPPNPTGAGDVMARSCTAITAAGAPCKLDAMRDTVPPRCMGHSGINGPRSKLSADVQNKVCAAQRSGLHVENAVEVAGIAHSTFHAWLALGHPDGDEPGNEPHRRFARAVDQARGQGDALRRSRVAAAAVTDWRAAAWMLETAYPERWGRPGRRVVASEPDWPLEPDADDDGPVAS